PRRFPLERDRADPLADPSRAPVHGRHGLLATHRAPRGPGGPQPAGADPPTAPLVLAVARRGDRLHFSVRVTPRASAHAVGGARDGALVVRVTAAPAEGAANEAVVRLVARTLRIAPSAVRLERGGTSR